MSEYTGTDNLEVMAEAVNYNRYLLSLIRGEMRQGLRVLDIGAGIGTFAKALRDVGHNVLCFEPDPRQADHLRSSGLPVVKGLEELQPSTFDFIYSLNVLEHIEDDLNTLRRWFHLLKPGGRMLVYVPAFQLLYSSMDRKVGHFRRYTKNGLMAKLRAAGFKVVSARYADSLGFIATIAYKLLHDESGNINRRALVTYDRYVFPLNKLFDAVFGSALGKNVYVVAVREIVPGVSLG